MKKPAGPYRCINVKMEKTPAQRAQGGMGLEQAIIDIRNMYKIYNPGENEVRALDGVSLAVYKGEFVAMVTLGYPDQAPKMPPRRDGRYTIV